MRGTPDEEPARRGTPVTTVTTTVEVEGMRTEHCKRAVFTALAAVPGIARAEVQLGVVTVEHDGTVTVAMLRDAIAVAGYAVTRGEERRRTLPVVDGAG